MNISRVEDLPQQAFVSGEETDVRALFHLGDTGVARRPGGLRAGHRQRQAAAMVPPALSSGCSCCRRSWAAALQRGRHESALRANVAIIEQLNARLEADNVYLKEEIKSYHDFDDIVGESATLRLALSRLVAGRADQFERAAARPDRHRQGAVRAGAARAQPPARAAARPRQLRGAAADAGRERAVRPREGARSPAPWRRGRGGSSWRTAARSSSTRSATCAPDIQVKFLRVLQEGEFERVGSSRTKTRRRAGDRGDAPRPRGGRRRRDASAPTSTTA